MRRGAIHLTPEQIDEAKRLYADGWSFARIGDRIGCDYKKIKMAVDQDFADFRRNQVNSARRQRRYKPEKRVTKTGRENASGASVKEDAAARLAEVPKDDRSVTGQLFGDPLRGRSALDKRQQA